MDASMIVRKALTFRASSIGDGLMGKYLLDNIHVQFPEARLGLVVSGRADMLRDLLSTYPYIEVIEANRRSPKTLWRLWRVWRGSDLVVTQYAGKPGGKFSLGSKCMARLLAKRVGLVGFADASGITRLLYSHVVSEPHAHSPAEDERRALRAAGLAVLQPYPALVVPADIEVLQKFGLLPGRYVIIHFFSGSIKRALHPDNRRKLVVALRKVLPADTQILLTGTTKERAEAQAAAGEEARTIAGEASLQEVIQLIANAAVTVSLDTGIGHIATQMRKPVVILSTCMGLWWWNAEQYGPDATYTAFSASLHKREEHPLEDYPACMNQIDILKVVQTVNTSNA